mgnify:CR=1 FL=1
MRNDVFSRSPFGRKAYAHGLHFDPALARSPLEPPLPPDSPILARWSAVRNCLPPLVELLDVEIVLMSAEGYCVGGTGTHRGGAARCPRTPRSRTACGAGRARWSCRRARMRSAVLSGPGGLHGYGEFHRPGARGRERRGRGADCGVHGRPAHGIAHEG